MFTWAEIDWDVIPEFSSVEDVHRARVSLIKNAAHKQQLDDWKARVDKYYMENPPGVLRPPDSWNGRTM